ncbi:hypothetical protein PVMG_05597, partial [Plasmodium vivax Mauritania I]
KEDPQFITSAQNTISGLINEVDSSTVLDASGGMGALFLLFKYTPVVSFFGERRGHGHRIPRSFNEQFTGGFPGYEEYYGGKFGHDPINI